MQLDFWIEKHPFSIATFTAFSKYPFQKGLIMANDQCKIIRAEIMLFLLVVYFFAFFVVRKYLLGFPRNKTPDILATQITITQVHEMDSNLDQLKRKLSFCKIIENRPIQVINV